ncbi:hypothetical protein PR048_010467 [Dryococelus australis]|uniref:Uncharacterized protein n=1 Tax=Dryococelus australis TaxID=614101 RepID=A0ABQ9I2U8_9NEOP|nr:hypothetical protein PR048_010467 [Dryococelus australis]
MPSNRINKLASANQLKSGLHVPRLCIEANSPSTIDMAHTHNMHIMKRKIDGTFRPIGDHVSCSIAIQPPCHTSVTSWYARLPETMMTGEHSINPRWRVGICLKATSGMELIYTSEAQKKIDWGDKSAVKGRGGAVVRLLALSPTVRFPAGSPPDPRMWGSCLTTSLVGGFSRRSPVSSALPFSPRFKAGLQSPYRPNTRIKKKTHSHKLSRFNTGAKGAFVIRQSTSQQTSTTSTRNLCRQPSLLWHSTRRRVGVGRTIQVAGGVSGRFRLPSVDATHATHTHNDRTHSRRHTRMPARELLCTGSQRRLAAEQLTCTAAERCAVERPELQRASATTPRRKRGLEEGKRRDAARTHNQHAAAGRARPDQFLFVTHTCARASERAGGRAQGRAATEGLPPFYSGKRTTCLWSTPQEGRKEKFPQTRPSIAFSPPSERHVNGLRTEALRFPGVAMTILGDTVRRCSATTEQRPRAPTHTFFPCLALSAKSFTFKRSIDWISMTSIEFVARYNLTPCVLRRPMQHAACNRCECGLDPFSQFANSCRAGFYDLGFEVPLPSGITRRTARWLHEYQ